MTKAVGAIQYALRNSGLARPRTLWPGLGSVCLVLFLPVLSYSEQGYVLDGFGGVHAMGGASVLSPATPYFGFDVARAIRLTRDGQGYYVLDGFGGVHAGGSAAGIGPAPPYFGFDIAKDMEIVTPAFQMVAPQPWVLANDGSFLNYLNFLTGDFRGTANSFEGLASILPVDCLLQKFTVSTNRVLVGSESITTTLMYDGADLFSCTLNAGESGCSPAATSTLAAGKKVAIRVNASNIDRTNNGIALVYWSGTCN